jgi:hypothetical protein
MTRSMTCRRLVTPATGLPRDRGRQRREPQGHASSRITQKRGACPLKFILGLRRKSSSSSSRDPWVNKAARSRVPPTSWPHAPRRHLGEVQNRKWAFAAADRGS